MKKAQAIAAVGQNPIVLAVQWVRRKAPRQKMASFIVHQFQQQTHLPLLINAR